MKEPNEPALNLQPLPAAPRLRPRQLECLAWAREGKSAGDIGVILGISSRTVEEHLANACDLLGVRTRLQAILRVQELGLLPAERPAAEGPRSFSRQARQPPPRPGGDKAGG